MWPPDEQSATAAKWITGILGGLFLAVKYVFKLRRDTREDRAGGATSEGYELIIAGLRAEITRLHASLDDLARRLDAEITVRRQMEAEAASLRRRADHSDSAAERSFARAAAGEEAALLLTAQIAALEMQVEKLEKHRGGYLPNLREDEL
jgi:hypothetical protein